MTADSPEFHVTAGPRTGITKFVRGLDYSGTLTEYEGIENLNKVNIGKK